MTLLERVRPIEPLSSRTPGISALALPVGVAVLVVVMASTSGAYFPTSWGWLGVVLGWVAAVALLVRREIALTTLELAVLGALAGFVFWVALSVLWSQDVPQTVLEIERDLLYPMALLTLLVLARQKSHSALLGALAAGITALCTYTLATRLFPDRLGGFDPTALIEGYRLNEPIGYWNALAIFAVMGIFLALGFATESRSTWIRALAAASLVVLVPTLYFTFSRGGWIALIVGLVAALAFSPRRLRLLTLTLALAPGPAIAVVVSSHLEGLTVPAALSRAAHDGDRLAVVIAVLAPVTAATAAAIGKAEPRLVIPAAARRAWGAVLVLAAVGALATIWVHYGSPPSLAQKAYDSFRGPGIEVKAGESIQKRLFSLSSSGRLDHWRVAWRDYAAHPVLGSGAGSYEQQWMQHRPHPGRVRDAHSLYMEVLAELGPVGLTLLLAAFVLPLAAAVRARRDPIITTAVGAYVAYLAHTGADWDWEMVVVTITALGIAGAMLVAARPRQRAVTLAIPSRIGLVVAVVAATAFSIVGLLGNFPLEESSDALNARRWQAAADDAHRAIRWQPWAGEPWKHLGRAQRQLGRIAEARRSFRRAVERDPGDSRAWFLLGKVTPRGPEQRRAYEEAARLDPFDADVQILCRVRYLPRALCRRPPA